MTFGRRRGKLIVFLLFGRHRRPKRWPMIYCTDNTMLSHVGKRMLAFQSGMDGQRDRGEQWSRFSGGLTTAGLVPAKARQHGCADGQVSDRCDASRGRVSSQAPPGIRDFLQQKIAALQLVGLDPGAARRATLGAAATAARSAHRRSAGGPAPAASRGPPAL
jgi:hypothetical protein